MIKELPIQKENHTQTTLILNDDDLSPDNTQEAIIYDSGEDKTLIRIFTRMEHGKAHLGCDDINVWSGNKTDIQSIMQYSVTQYKTL